MLRKAMGKKQIDKMQKLKKKFMAQGMGNGHSEQSLEKIWADWEKFASYAFNKSHATCYSWVAFQTAYLKANYPSEYMAAVLSRNLTDITKLTGFMAECKSMGINVKGPDVNESYSSFGVNRKGDIRFGLSAIKGVGGNVVRDIVEERNAHGPYRDIYDFVERVPAGSVNRRVFESLAIAGAFDCFEGIKREDLVEPNARGEVMSELLLRYGNQYQSMKQANEASLFGDFDDEINTAGRPVIEAAVPWSDIARLDKERELVGMYLSAHPLDPYYMELSHGVSHTLKALEEETHTDGQEVSFGGIITSYTERTLQSGSQMGIIKLEDFTGTHEIVFFSRQLIEFRKFGQEGLAILVRGVYRKNAKGDLRFNIGTIELLEEVKGTLISGITVNLALDSLKGEAMEILNNKIKSAKKGDGKLNLRIFDPEINRSVTLASNARITLDRELMENLDSLSDITYTIQTA